MEISTKVLWIYWHQGWENAPEIPLKCLESWEANNYRWTIKKICQKTLSNYIDLEQELSGIAAKDITLTALSDVIRILLLEKFGGVWVDSTLLCRIPLDNWLPYFEEEGFFAFSKPEKDRLVSSWFLFAKKDNYIIKKWREKTLAYWDSRNSTDNYFWFHYQFNELYEADETFKKSWDNSTKVSADAPHFLAPYNTKFFEKIDERKINAISKLQSPVLKLTYKYDLTKDKADTILNYILTENIKVKKIKILVTWYGSFSKNGTVGDYLSVNSLTHFLEKHNYDFDCASYKPFHNLKGNPIELENALPSDYDIIIFCCGPILKNHENLNSLFEKFKTLYKVGIGVSLFPKDHFNFYNPFDFVLARENGTEMYEDIAIIASHTKQTKYSNQEGLKIGLILRNEQHEYGKKNCKSDKAYLYLMIIAKTLIGTRETFSNKLMKLFTKGAPAKASGTILEINNHLETSGLTPQEIENQYSECDLILTTRFHGSMLALRNDIPFIALDQIKNGAKVYKLVSQTGYPFVWKINKLSLNKLKKTAFELINNKHHEKLANAKLKAETNASFTLKQLHGHLLAYIPK